MSGAHELVDSHLEMLSRLLGEHIAVEFCPQQSLPQVRADIGMIEQVLMNLALNGRDAMPKGGRLTILTQSCIFTAADQHQESERRAGQFVCLAVGDTGHGMDKTTLERVFEPFFTTKEVDRGTGLGLATAYGICKQHGGWIEVESEVGSGSTFRVFLPAAPNARADDAKEPRSQPLLREAETILLVEDEPAVRQIAGRSSRACGYTVLEASCPSQAQTLWRQHREEISLLFTDMVMPEGINGLELAHLLRQEKPSLKVVISSGYSSELVASGVPQDAISAFIPKPFDLRRLAATVRACLDKQ